MSALYCDGLQEVTVGAGVARLEFYRVAANRAGDPRQTQRLSEMTLALPVQALTEMLTLLQRARDQLVKDGVLSAEEPAPRLPSPPLIGVDIPFAPGKG
jgi:hypothetical protein